MSDDNKLLPIERTIQRHSRHSLFDPNIGTIIAGLRTPKECITMIPDYDGFKYSSDHNMSKTRVCIAKLIMMLVDIVDTRTTKILTFSTDHAHVLSVNRYSLKLQIQFSDRAPITIIFYDGVFMKGGFVGNRFRGRNITGRKLSDYLFKPSTQNVTVFLKCTEVNRMPIGRRTELVRKFQEHGLAFTFIPGHKKPFVISNYSSRGGASGTYTAYFNLI